MPDEASLAAHLSRAERVSLIAAVVGAAACIAFAVLSWREFLQGYLTSYVFWIGPALGAMYWLMTHHLTGGQWGWVIRRPSEVAVLSIPMMAALFIPIVIGLRQLYDWVQLDLNSPEALVHGKNAYLSIPFFLGRTMIYFAAWIALTIPLYLWSRQQDAHYELRVTSRLGYLSGGGLVVLFLTVSFAFVDWVASLQPEWTSTIYGLYVIVGQAMTALVLLILVIGALLPEQAEEALAWPNSLHDLGNLLLMTVVLYTYMAFAQYFIIWNGNLPHEIAWYTRRSTGAWAWVVAVLALLHFFLPFGALLSRTLKRRRRAMMLLAIVILAARVLDTCWFVLPSFDHLDWRTFLAALCSFVLLGGVWLTWFFRKWRQAPLFVSMPAALEAQPT